MKLFNAVFFFLGVIIALGGLFYFKGFLITFIGIVIALYNLWRFYKE